MTLIYLGGIVPLGTVAESTLENLIGVHLGKERLVLVPTRIHETITSKMQTFFIYSRLGTTYKMYATREQM